MCFIYYLNCGKVEVYIESIAGVITPAINLVDKTKILVYSINGRNDQKKSSKKG